VSVKTRMWDASWTIVGWGYVLRTGCGATGGVVMLTDERCSSVESVRTADRPPSVNWPVMYQVTGAAVTEFENNSSKPDVMTIARKSLDIADILVLRSLTINTVRRF